MLYNDNNSNKISLDRNLANVSKFFICKLLYRSIPFLEMCHSLSLILPSSYWIEKKKKEIIWKNVQGDRERLGKVWGEKQGLWNSVVLSGRPLFPGDTWAETPRRSRSPAHEDLEGNETSSQWDGLEQGAPGGANYGALSHVMREGLEHCAAGSLPPGPKAGTCHWGTHVPGGGAALALPWEKELGWSFTEEIEYSHRLYPKKFTKASRRVHVTSELGFKELVEVTQWQWKKLVRSKSCMELWAIWEL